MEKTFGPWAISVRRVWPEPTDIRIRYDKAAASWHTVLRRNGQLGAYAYLVERAEREAALGIRDPMWVLDCGIGTGALSLAVAGRLSGRLHVAGVDLSPRMIESARNRLREAGIEGDLRTEDVRQMSFGSATFDLVLCGHILEHLQDPEPALREMLRVTRPGGRLVASATRQGAVGSVVTFRWQNRAFREDELRAAAARAGYENVNVFRYGWGLPRLATVAMTAARPAGPTLPEASRVEVVSRRTSGTGRTPSGKGVRHDGRPDPLQKGGTE